MYQYDRRTAKSSWKQEFLEAAKKAQQAAEAALKASLKARTEINALRHLSAKNQFHRTEMMADINHVDTLLHKSGSPIDLFTKVETALGRAVEMITPEDGTPFERPGR